jgi:Spy/CpxP family protein refolding chaperone
MAGPSCHRRDAPARDHRKEFIVKTTTKIIAAVAATAALALAGAVSAQPGAGPAFGMGPGWGGMGPGNGMGPGWGGMGPGNGMGPGWGGMGPGGGHMGGWGGRMGGGSFGMMGLGGFDMNAAAAGRLAALKTQLKITAAQDSAWKAYETAVTQQASAMQAMRDQFHAQWQNAKPGEAGPDIAAQHQAMAALRQSGWEAQAKASKELYAALTPEQQAFMNGGWGPRGLPRR